jgi:hypothetical protein
VFVAGGAVAALTLLAILPDERTRLEPRGNLAVPSADIRAAGT